jgi:hypothetical protein
MEIDDTKFRMLRIWHLTVKADFFRGFMNLIGPIKSQNVRACARNFDVVVCSAIKVSPTVSQFFQSQPEQLTASFFSKILLASWNLS